MLMPACAPLHLAVQTRVNKWHGASPGLPLGTGGDCSRQPFLGPAAAAAAASVVVIVMK